MQYTQPALFPDTEIVGTGQPQPWPAGEVADDITPTIAAEHLPLNEDAA